MNRLIISAVSVLLITYASSVGAANQPTPVTSPGGKSLTPHPLLHQVNLEMKQQWQKIMIDQKNGKLSTSQAKTLRENLTAIRKQVGSFSKNNPNHELTNDQASQINQQLQTNAQTIP